MNKWSSVTQFPHETKNTTVRSLAIPALIILTIFCASCSQKNDPNAINLMALNEKGEEVIQPVEKEGYSKQVAQAVTAIEASAITTLRENAAKSSWKLEVVTVGIGAVIGVDMAGIVGIEVNPAFRLAFTNVQNPPIP